MVDFSEFKKFFLFNLIGALIISAIVAVITVLIGEFNEITGRVMLTLFMVVAHSLVSLAFIWNDEKQATFEKLSFFTNVLFFIIVLSFISSILGIWKVIPSDIVSKLYLTYFVLGFASLHSNILSKALDKESYLDFIIYANYVLVGIVTFMLLPIIYMTNSSVVLGEMYYRFLGAAAIIDGTLSILTIIFYKIYAHKHHEAENIVNSGEKKNSQKKGWSIWIWILIIYLIAQIGLPIIFFATRRLF